MGGGGEGGGFWGGDAGGVWAACLRGGCWGAQLRIREVVKSTGPFIHSSHATLAPSDAVIVTCIELVCLLGSPSASFDALSSAASHWGSGGNGGGGGRRGGGGGGGRGGGGGGGFDGIGEDGDVDEHGEGVSTCIPEAVGIALVDLICLVTPQWMSIPPPPSTTTDTSNSAGGDAGGSSSSAAAAAAVLARTCAVKALRLGVNILERVALSNKGLHRTETTLAILRSIRRLFETCAAVQDAATAVASALTSSSSSSASSSSSSSVWSCPLRLKTIVNSLGGLLVQFLGGNGALPPRVSVVVRREVLRSFESAVAFGIKFTVKRTVTNDDGDDGDDDDSDDDDDDDDDYDDDDEDGGDGDGVKGRPRWLRVGIKLVMSVLGSGGSGDTQEGGNGGGDGGGGGGDPDYITRDSAGKCAAGLVYWDRLVTVDQLVHHLDTHFHNAGSGQDVGGGGDSANDGEEEREMNTEEAARETACTTLARTLLATAGSDSQVGEPI